MAVRFLKYDTTLFPLPCKASVDFQYMLLGYHVTGYSAWNLFPYKIFKLEEIAICA